MWPNQQETMTQCLEVQTQLKETNLLQVDRYLYKGGYMRGSSDYYFIMENGKCYILYGQNGKMEFDINEHLQNEFLEKQNVIQKLPPKLNDAGVMEPETDEQHLIRIRHTILDLIDYRLPVNKKVALLHKDIHFDYLCLNPTSDDCERLLIVRELFEYLTFMRVSELDNAKSYAYQFMFTRTNLPINEFTKKLIANTLHAYVYKMTIPLFDKYLSTEILEYTDIEFQNYSKRQFNKFYVRANKLLTNGNFMERWNIILKITDLFKNTLLNKPCVFTNGNSKSFERSMLY